MNDSKLKTEEIKKASSPFYMIPEEFLDSMLSRQDRILEFIGSMDKTGLNGYITEKQAGEILNKKSTWFWKMRRSRRLPYKKIGSTIYYLSSDIKGLFEKEE
jgi:hypothetical protein